MKQLTACFRLSATILFMSLTCLAQSTKESTPELTLVFVSGAARNFEMPVFNGGGGSSSNFKRIDWWKPANGESRAQAVDIRLGRDGEVAIVTLYATLENDKQVKVGTYRLKEGETVTTEELKAFGIEPCVLKVVRAKPHVEEPLPPITAQLDNKTKSLEVVEFFQEAPPSTSFRLTVRNASQKNVTGLDFYMPSPDGNGGGGQSSTGNKARPIMIPGGVSTHFIGLSRPVRLTPNGYVYDDVSKQTVIIRAVMFEDGTYEGMAEVVAQLEAGRRGLEVQRRRVLRLLQEVSNSNDVNTLTLDAVKERAYALSKTGEESDVSDILARFPSLDSKWKDTLRVSVGTGLSTGKQEFLRFIREFEEKLKQPGTRVTLADWAKQMSSQYEQLINEQ